MSITWQERFKDWQGINPIERDLEPYLALVSEINQQGLGLSCKSDEELKEQIQAIKKEIQAGASLKDVCIAFYAIGREVAHRTLGMRPFDVQILAGLALLNGKLIEMKTGEGKTLAAVLPACL